MGYYKYCEKVGRKKTHISWLLGFLSPFSERISCTQRKIDDSLPDESIISPMFEDTVGLPSP